MIFLSTVTDGSDSRNYLYDYLAWAKATYSFAVKNRDKIDWQKACFKTKVPMRLVDGNIYWVNQEIHPLELDELNNVISHINTYTVLNKYTEKSQIGLLAELYYNDFYDDQLTKELTAIRFSIQPFIVTQVQIHILHFFYQNPTATTIQCAAKLKRSINTIKKGISDSLYHKGIIDKAKVSFQGITICTVKDVVVFLEKIGWFKS